jgi:hypothetical protein
MLNTAERPTTSWQLMTPPGERDAAAGLIGRMRRQ